MYGYTYVYVYMYVCVCVCVCVAQLLRPLMVSLDDKTSCICVITCDFDRIWLDKSSCTVAQNEHVYDLLGANDVLWHMYACKSCATMTLTFCDH